MLKYSLEKIDDGEFLYKANLKSFDDEYDDFIADLRVHAKYAQKIILDNQEIFDLIWNYYVNEPCYDEILCKLSDDGIEIYADELLLNYEDSFYDLIREKTFSC